MYRLHLVERVRLPPAVAADLDGRVAISPTGYVRCTEYAYVLDLVGAQILAIEDTDGEVVGRVRWRTDRALAIESSPRLAHTLGINQVSVDLAATSRTTLGTELVAWWGEQGCQDRLQGLVNPDRIDVWEQDHRRVLFALEYDRGTETLARARPQAGGLPAPSDPGSLDMYHANAIDIATLKREQDRVGADITTAWDKLADLDANHAVWQEILTLTAALPAGCADAYRKADNHIRRLFNQAVFDKIDIKDGRARARPTESHSTGSSA